MKISSLDLPDRNKRLDEVDLVPYEELPEHIEVEELAHGLKKWVNPINGFTVLRLHYSADPKKRSEDWKANEKRKYGESEWNREYELIWESVEGRAVYADYWSPEFHISKHSLGWDPRFPVCRGWDFGLNGACVFTQLFPHSRLFVLRECVSEDIGFERFVEEVNRCSLEWFPGARFVEFVDPTGRYRMGADERTYAMILANRPLAARKILSGANDMTARIKGVTDFLKDNVKGLPSYLVDPSCETLIKGYNGGYHYPFDNKGVLKDKPEKDFFSHVHDANQYVCSKVKSAKLDFNQLSRGVKEARYHGRQPTVSY